MTTNRFIAIRSGMDFSPSARSAELTERVRTFVTTEIEPVEPEIHRDIKTRRDENGNLYSNTTLGKGEASLWAIEFRGEITASMVYDGQPVIDHFKRVDDTTVMGIMNGKGGVIDGRHLYFYLERV